MTEQDVRNTYDVDHDVIRSPGAFEGEHVVAPLVQEMVLNGFETDTIYDGDTPIDLVELEPNRFYTYEVSDQGFVHVEYVTMAEWEDYANRIG